MGMMDGEDAGIELRQETKEPVNNQNLTTGSMVDSFGTLIWDHNLDGSNFGYFNLNFQTGGTSTSSRPVRAQLGLNQDLVLRKEIFQPGFPSELSQRAPHLPTDSKFIERAARLSSFGGSFAQMMSPFPLPHSMNPFISKPVTGMSFQRHDKDEIKCASFINSVDDAKSGARVSGNESDDADFSHEHSMPAESSHKGLDPKKRKKHVEQNIERNKEITDMKLNTDQNRTKNASGGKNAKAETSDLLKDAGYVHVRARRGQATNSHSLAERVRREKISERMKFLQDLVPGCSKVTGKAVMLDEIINYVQSLQRQVEFLSMKLATVYPHMNFNLEESVAKDAFRSLPTTVPLPPPLPHPPQHEMVHSGSSSIIIRRPMMNIPTTSQVPDDPWGDELHNVVHMGFNSSPAKTKQ